MNEATLLLTALVFLPSLAALVLAFLPSDKPDLLRYFTLATTVVVFVLMIMGLLLGGNESHTRFDPNVGTMQDVVNVSWIPSFNIQYFLGIDGISLPLVILTGFVTVLSMGASWSITKYVKGYCILYLLLFTGMIGVFVSLDFFLFYVFWEVMLLPMYFLIGVWGGPRKEYAAIKFFLYTLVGSVLMLIAILMLYFSSDVRALAELQMFRTGPNADFEWSSLHLGPEIEAKIGRAESATKDANAKLVVLRKGAGADKPLAVNIVYGDSSAATYDGAANKLDIIVTKEKSKASDVVATFAGSADLWPVAVVVLPDGSDGSGQVTPADSISIPAYNAGKPVHSFNLLALAAMGQRTELFDMHVFKGTWCEGSWLDQSLQWWAFVLLFIGFAIKVPAVPVHTWLPDAHVEAPTPISMILAGVLLKMGGYGFIRICYPICPDGGYDLAWLVCTIGVVSMVYGAFAALAQKDFKRMVAYSSVSHMGYVTLGLGVWSATQYNGYDSQYWNMGISAAMFQMIGHGVSSPGMFFMVGIIYDRVHHRNLDEFGGLFGRMPVYTAMAMGIFFAGLGLPGLCGFPGEAFVVLSSWKYSMPLAVISAAVVVLTASYILWSIQRVYLGAEYKGPHGDHITPSNTRENLIGMTILGFCILLGVLPYQTVFRFMEKTIDRQVDQLTEWTATIKEKDAVSNPIPTDLRRDDVSPATTTALPAGGDSEI